MIHISKDKTPPQILLDNADKWTDELKNNICKYGGYAKIPIEIKNAMWTHYRHESIKDKLFASSFNKCAFCESKPAESGNIEVEHFKPKSLYPDLAFKWDNFLPVCRKCNDSKRDHDTGNEPIVNPSVDNPEEIFTYCFLNIVPIKESDTVAEKTIEVCDLNSERLYDARSKLLHSLCSYEHQAKEWIKEIDTSDTQRKRINRINRLRDSVEILDKLMDAEQTYAGFCRYFLNNSKDYKRAKQLLEEES